MIEERRQPFVIDEAKFSTQRLVTYVVLLIFTAVTANVLVGTDQAERSTIIQTVINFAMLSIGFWLGSSKAAADSGAAIGGIMKPQAEAMARIAEAAPTAANGKPKEQVP